MAGGGGSDHRWLVSYGDLVTLLMAFFVALFGISHADQNKFQRLLTGLGPFDNPAASRTGPMQGGSGVVGEGSPDVMSTLSDSAVGERNAPRDHPGSVPGDHAASANPAAGGESLIAQSPRFAGAEDLPGIRDELAGALHAQGLAGSVSFRIDDDALVAIITTDNVLFASGSPSISDDGRRIIAAIAPTLAGLTNPVRVEGHTDTVPLHRAGYTNWNLSTDRAVAIVALLQDAFGIDPKRLAAIGYGEHHPRAPNEDARGRALNRRVEVVISSATGGRDGG